MNALDLIYVPAAVVTAPWWARRNALRLGRAVRAHRAVAGSRPGRETASPARGLRRRGQHAPCARADDARARHRSRGLGRHRHRHRPRPALFGQYVRRPCRAATRLDFSPAARRFLNAVQPDAAALVELEVWPNFIHECSRPRHSCLRDQRAALGPLVPRLLASPPLPPLHVRALAFAAVQDEDYAAASEQWACNPTGCT